MACRRPSSARSSRSSTPASTRSCATTTSRSIDRGDDVKSFRQLLAALALGVAATAAAAQSFPSKPVRLVVPFPPGGATDALARLMADKLAERWKQPVVVENKPGANTTLGTDVVAKSAPDGHVLGIVTGSHIINP